MQGNASDAVMTHTYVHSCMKMCQQDYVRSVRAKLKEKGTPQPEIKEFMAQAPGMVK